MNISTLIQAARLSMPLVPAAQRPLAEMLLTEADRINDEYEVLKAHVQALTTRVNQLTTVANEHTVLLRNQATTH